MANIIEAFNDVFTEEYALAKFFVYAIPVFTCINAFARGQFVLSYFCGFFVVFLMLGLMTCGINNLRENKQEILTFKFQWLAVATVKTAVAITPHISIAAMIGFFVQELMRNGEELSQIQVIVNIFVWCILISIITTAYLSFTKHLNIKEAYNFKLILESIVDVFVNLVFLVIQIIIADCACIGLMSYVFTVFNLPLVHPIFLFFCSMLLIVNVSVTANILSQASYECIKGKDEDYKDRYKIGSTLATATFSPGGMTATGTFDIQSPSQPNQTRNNRGFSGSRNQTNQSQSPEDYTGSSPDQNSSSSSRGGLNRAPGSRRPLGGGSSTNRQSGNSNRNLRRRPTTGGDSRRGNTNSGGGNSSDDTPKRKFGNTRRTGGSGFGQNKFGNNKKNNGGGGFFKKK